ncbi:MAG: hypothetical protein UU32_C0038G0005, partial [Candidatus Woesebacteria bacterium GW2011_GWB1_41_10]
ESLKGKQGPAFEVPGGIVNAMVDSVSGYHSHDGFPERNEKFIKGTEPREDTVHVKLKVCKTDGKLATPSDIAGGNYEEKEFFVFKEEDPTASNTAGSVNRWQEGILKWLSGQGDSHYHPPSDYCGTGNPVNVEFVNPQDQTSNMPNAFTVKFKADSSSDIVETSLEIDGTKIRSFDSQPFEHEVNLTDGIHVIKAKAKDSAGHESERAVTIGVNTSWEATPVPTVNPT